MDKHLRLAYSSEIPGMLLCLPQMQKNSKRYWNKARNLSLPLLLAMNTEKKIEKSLVFIMSFLVISPVIWALLRSSLSEMECLKTINLMIYPRLQS